MISLSSRFAPHLLVAVALVLAAMIAAGGDRRQEDDCADPEALLRARDFGANAPFGSREDMPAAALQWSHGKHGVSKPVPFEMELSLVRTLSSTPIFLRPLSISRVEILADRSGFEWVGSGVDALPIHYRYEDASSQPKVAAYFYIHDGRPVKRPFVTKLADSLDLLLHGAKPLSVFMAVAPVPLRRVDLAEDATTRWLERAWQVYAEACMPERAAPDAS